MVWWQDYFSCVDSLDMDKIADWFAADIELQFANIPIKGQKAAMEAIAGFTGQLTGMKHKLGPVLENGDELFADAVVTYSFHDGRVLNIPAGTYIKRSHQKILDLRIYIDLSPVYAK